MLSAQQSRSMHSFCKHSIRWHLHVLCGLPRLSNNVDCSIRRVKLRREAATNSFRGSVYIEFSDAAAAQAAVSSPPQQPHAASSSGGTPSRFHVMMKSEYERKRANATSSAGGGRDGGSGGGGGSGSAHKRPRHRSDGPTPSSHRIPPPPPPPPPPPVPGDQHAPVPPPAADQHHQAYQQQPQDQHWRQVAEEREAAVRALEESLRKEKEDNQRLYQRLEEAQQRAQEAATREGAANQKVLTRDVEIGSLKGEIAMLRTQGAAQLERQSVAHKARVTELEASLQRLKDALLEKERGERELRKAAAAASGRAGENGGGRRSGAGPGNDVGGGDRFLDDL